MVRKYTYKDYYLAAGEYGFQAKPEHLRIHIGKIPILLMS